MMFLILEGFSNLEWLSISIHLVQEWGQTPLVDLDVEYNKANCGNYARNMFWFRKLLGAKTDRLTSDMIRRLVE